MRTPLAGIVIGSALALAAVGTSSPAWASGGTSSGGVNSGGVNSGGTASGGGGAAPCAQITAFNVTAGKTPGDSTTGAVWTTYTVKNCSTAAGNYTGSLTYRNLSTGQTTTGGCPLSSTASAPGGYYVAQPMSPGQSVSCTLDNDRLPLGTSFEVSLVVTDNSSMGVLASNAKTVATPSTTAG